MLVQAGSIDVTTYFHLRNTDGTDATGLTIANIDLQYTRSGATPAAKVDAQALAAANTAHTDNFAFEIDATDQPGVYRVDWADAAFASGVREVILTVKCTGVRTESLRVQITGFDPADGVRMGITALPNAAAEAAGGLYTRGSGAGQINQNANGQVDARGVALAADVITATAIQNDAITAAKIADNAIDAGAIASDAITAAKIATGAITSAKFAAGAIDAAAIANNAIDAATFAADVDAKALSWIVSDATRITAVALNTLSGHDPGETIMGATDLGTGSGLTSLASAANLAVVAGYLDTEVAAILAAVDTEVAAIKAKTDGLPSDPADESQVQAAIAAVAAQITALNNLSAAQVNAEVVGVLSTNTHAEPGQGNPPATTSIQLKLDYLYQAWRNRTEQTATELRLYLDNGTTVARKAAVSDDGTSAIRGELVTGP